MKRAVMIPAFIGLLLFTNAAGTAQRSGDWKEIEKEPIQRSLAFANPGVPGELSVDNVFGSLRVTAWEGRTVELQIEKTTRAFSREDIELAGKEVELKITQSGNRIEVYVDGPFRNRDGWGGERHSRYIVNYDFTIRVPRSVGLELRTVNGGDVHVEGTDGDFEINNVNGGIRMNGVAGSGKVRTVNGPVNAAFVRKPDGDCDFATVNGDIDVAFPPDVSADIWFKTFNGSAYSDFELSPLPQPSVQPERREGKYVYRSNRLYGGRVAGGGPRIAFDTLNGNIHITTR